MGCDGGTIPTRDELVRTKKKPEQKDKNADLAAKWKYCAISQEQLQPPIVACQLGRLYKKDKVIEFLLDKSKFDLADSFDHIKGLKDIKELQLTENQSFKKGKAEVGNGYVDRAAAQYICPVTGLEMSGTFKFVFLWNCGCVFSKRALKEIKTDLCHKCQQTFKKDDVVILNGTDEDIQQMRANMEHRKLLAKQEKKSKKKHKLETATCCTSTGEPAPKMPKSESTTKPPADVTSTSKLSNGSSLKTGKSANGRGVPVVTATIQKDPTATKAFKSLFTTSEKAKNQPTPHWVTYNPCYY